MKEGERDQFPLRLRSSIVKIETKEIRDALNSKDPVISVIEEIKIEIRGEDPIKEIEKEIKLSDPHENILREVKEDMDNKDQSDMKKDIDRIKGENYNKEKKDILLKVTENLKIHIQIDMKESSKGKVIRKKEGMIKECKEIETDKIRITEEKEGTDHAVLEISDIQE